MKLDASSPLKGIMFRRPRVILKTRQFIGLSVCLWIQEGTAWNSQVTLKHWSFSRNDKFPEGAKLCKNSFVKLKVPRRLCVLLWRCCPIWAAENPSGSAVCELPDQRCSNDHLKSHKNTFLPHSEARFSFSGSSWPHLPAWMHRFAWMHRELLWCDWLVFYLC